MGALGTLVKNWNPLSRSTSATLRISLREGLCPFCMAWLITKAAHCNSSREQRSTDLPDLAFFVRSMA